MAQPPSPSIRTLLVSLGCALLCAACATSRRTMEFLPSPAEVLVQAEGEPSEAARVLISIPYAIRERNEGDGRSRMIVRMRVENRGDRSLELELAKTKLVDSNLVAFGTPELRSGPTSLGAGEEAILTLGFPYPEGLSLAAPQVTGVNIQWTLSNGERAWESSLNLERAREQRDNFGPGFGWGLGVGFGASRLWGPRACFTRSYLCY